MSQQSPLDDHFLSPRNAGVLEDADFKVRVENPVCGDLLDLYVQCAPDGTIAACTHQVYGCPAAIAAGSVLTEMARGRTLDELEAVGHEEISAALGRLPDEKIHAAHLARDAIRAVVRELKGRSAESIEGRDA